MKVCTTSKELCLRIWLRVSRQQAAYVRMEIWKISKIYDAYYIFKFSACAIIINRYSICMSICGFPQIFGFCASAANNPLMLIFLLFLFLCIFCIGLDIYLLCLWHFVSCFSRRGERAFGRLMYPIGKPIHYCRLRMCSSMFVALHVPRRPASRSREASLISFQLVKYHTNWDAGYIRIFARIPYGILFNETRK